ncbi:hypothetical protein PFISCL1PPCAC_26972, partial [Pristionchus fissidentatus]
RLVSDVIPTEFCCLHAPLNSKIGLVGKQYNVSSAPIRVLDSQTFLVPSFSFRGSLPPDGWFFAGSGKIERGIGRKALIQGRDRLGHHCAMHEDYVSEDVVVRLAGDQTVYDISFLSVFCYDFDVDFGHVNLDLNPKSHPLPAFIPPIGYSPPEIE